MKQKWALFYRLSVEMLEGRLERLDLFRNLGVRVMQLSYNRKSQFAAGVMEPKGGGLTTLGKEAVKKMNALGITIDLSHANESTTSDVIGHVIETCNSLPCGVRRNTPAPA